MQCETI